MKLSVSDQVIVPVKFSLKDGKAIKQFAYTLTCQRLTSKEWEDRITDPESGRHTPARIRDTMADITTGWQNQTLVLDDSGEPAECCAEAVDIMLGASGVLDVVVVSYMKESGARAKN
jgi:hypothetical protein